MAVFLDGGGASGDEGVEGVVLAAPHVMVVQVLERASSSNEVGHAAIVVRPARRHALPAASLSGWVSTVVG